MFSQKFLSEKTKKSIFFTIFAFGYYNK